MSLCPSLSLTHTHTHTSEPKKQAATPTPDDEGVYNKLEDMGVNVNGYHKNGKK